MKKIISNLLLLCLYTHSVGVLAGTNVKNKIINSKIDASDLCREALIPSKYSKFYAPVVHMMNYTGNKSSRKWY